MDEFLDKASDYAFAQLNEVGGNLEKLPLPLQTVVVIYTAQGIIDNGGFVYFFESDFPNNPDYKLFSECYRRIGADSAANNLDTAIELFGFDDPHIHEQKRRAFLEALGEEDIFIKLGDEICGDESIWERLSIYATSEKNAFIHAE